MCNLYSHTSNIESIRRMVGDFKRIHDNVGNLEPQPGIFPDYPAPIVRNTPEGRELAKVRWGLPSSQKALYDAASRRADKLREKGKPVDFDKLLKMEPDSGTTNVRNIKTAAGRWNQHWNRWMGVENRCVVPFTSFSEFDNTVENGQKKGDTWFAFDESRPLAFFAGIWVGGWEGVRKIKLGLEKDMELFGFLTCEPNDVVGSIHMKAMPVILTEPEEIETWLTAPKEDAIALQRPLPDGVLEIVSVGKKSDQA
ncbi:MAG: SOS response-associated peptidase family protein [Devosia sp.]|uniref:SOS response-associated peptidase n=1 Tax=Devosia sp. TaxID=1871048 RepID=UPI0024C9B3A3|nr:SOS response-associated peptidase family protein [Devosia sp.]UYN98339.1 MAG: SOS response-associated peptidase family protein [Devosia sp.]